MFPPKILTKIAKKYQEPLKNLGKIEETLNDRFMDLSAAIRALILAVASGEPLLLIGPPGTAKSRLIRAFCGLIGLLNEDDPSRKNTDYFEYLLTPFTEPGELFGYYNVAKATLGTLERMDEGMMQHAQVVYLDEVFNSSSAILNSILAFMNERIFHDRGNRKPVAMKCLFGATNRIPDTPELQAIFDRFVLRCRIENVDSESGSIGTLIQKGWKETYSSHKSDIDVDGLLGKIDAFRRAIISYTDKGELDPATGDKNYKILAQLVHCARQYDLSEMSNRRLIKMTYIMLIHRIYEAAIKDKVEEELYLRKEERQLFYRYFLDRTDEESIQKMERAV